MRRQEAVSLRLDIHLDQNRDLVAELNQVLRQHVNHFLQIRLSAYEQHFADCCDNHIAGLVDKQDEMLQTRLDR